MAVCVTDTSSTYVRLFDSGEILSINNSFGRNDNTFQEPANMIFDFKKNEVLYEHNSNIQNKYMCFMTKTSDGLSTFQWVHFSIHNLDSVVIHDAFSTHLE